MAGKIKFIIDSELANVSLVGMAVNKICSRIPMDEIQANQMELCVVEAVTNVIEHAYENESNHKISISMALHKDHIIFQIEDTGKRMALARPAAMEFDPQDRENLPEGGMGIFIIHQIMDNVGRRVVDGHNLLTMTKNF